MQLNDLMKEAGLPLPEFTTEGMFTIKLQRGPEVKNETVEDVKPSEKNSLELSEKKLGISDNEYAVEEKSKVKASEKTWRKL